MHGGDPLTNYLLTGICISHVCSETFSPCSRQTLAGGASATLYCLQERRRYRNYILSACQGVTIHADVTLP